MRLSAERARSDLEELLQERDLDRPLDSLEVTVVQAYLARHGITAERTAAGPTPTIRDWLTWVDRCSVPSSTGHRDARPQGVG